MADRSKIIFVNTDGQYEETSSADSLQFASYKTAGFELTNTLLGKIVNAITTSAGAGDAAKFILTNSAGKVDISLIDVPAIDHGLLAGLLDDDHTQYTRADGTRAFTGAQSMGGFKLTNLAVGTAPTDAVNKSQLDSAVSGLQDFRESVIDKDLSTPPSTPATGDRYIVGPSATGAWTGLENKIVEWNGSAWVSEPNPDMGTYVYIEDEFSAYVFNNNTFASGSWIIFSSGVFTASLGVKKVGSDFQADLVSGGGLGLTGNSLRIAFSTTFNDALAVKASDMNGTGFAQYIGVNTTNISQSTATTLQGVLDDLSNAIEDDDSVSYTAAANVAKGDLVYVSGNNAVTKLPVSGGASNNRGIGLASATVASSGTVKVLADDEVVTGVLTGATAGTPYYWTGTALSDTAPTAGGSMVWEVGVAKNATDLHVGIRQIKRNS